MSDPMALLAGALSERPVPRLLVVTGAGISVASGIPTFRGTDSAAVWNRETTEIGTATYFERDPVGWWRWVLELRDPVVAARPNPGHLALAELERWQTEERGGEFLLVTQNIDSLHEAAGSKRLVKVHGSADRVRCSRLGCRYGSPLGSLPAADFDLATLASDPRRQHLPRCPDCTSLVRGHVLLFDEYYDEHLDYQFDRVQQELELTDLVLFVGTSFSVGITEIVLRSALMRRLRTFLIDPIGGRIPSSLAVVQIQEKAEVGLPRLCGALRACPGNGTAP